MALGPLHGPCRSWIELKIGRASDVGVGQIQRDIGFVIEELPKQNQTVKGLIIALDDDSRIRRALAVAKNIDFYRYAVTFKLFPVVEKKLLGNYWNQILQDFLGHSLNIHS